MQLLAVEVAEFRNLRSVLVEPHPRANVLSGDNGQGKTNFLEAIYLLATLRSFRAARLEELVAFGAPAARAGARVSHRGLDRRYQVEIAGEPVRKTAWMDGKVVRAAADYFGGFNVVLFVPEDLRLARGSPGGRRRFLDRAVWNADPAFLREAQTYEKVLRSRNALLRDGTTTGRGPEDLLAVYDEQLSAAGAQVVARRRRYLSAVAPRVAAAFERIGRAGVPAVARYAGGLSGADGELKDELLAALRAARPRDRHLGYTTAGPHADDLELLIDGRPARTFASQGQTRALVLALKVAEIQHLHEVLGDAPILLLDDVSSELDPSRNAFLFEFLVEVPCQLFITTTDPAHVPFAADRRDFRVEAGALSPAGAGPGSRPAPGLQNAE